MTEEDRKDIILSLELIQNELEIILYRLKKGYSDGEGYSGGQIFE